MAFGMSHRVTGAQSSVMLGQANPNLHDAAGFQLLAGTRKRRAEPDPDDPATSQTGGQTRAKRRFVDTAANAAKLAAKKAALAAMNYGVNALSSNEQTQVPRASRPALLADQTSGELEVVYQEPPKVSAADERKTIAEQLKGAALAAEEAARRAGLTSPLQSSVMDRADDQDLKDALAVKHMSVSEAVANRVTANAGTASVAAAIAKDPVGAASAASNFAFEQAKKKAAELALKELQQKEEALTKATSKTPGAASTGVGSKTNDAKRPTVPPAVPPKTNDLKKTGQDNAAKVNPKHKVDKPNPSTDKTDPGTPSNQEVKLAPEEYFGTRLPGYTVPLGTGYATGAVGTALAVGGEIADSSILMLGGTAAAVAGEYLVLANCYSRADWDDKQAAVMLMGAGGVAELLVGYVTNMRALTAIGAAGAMAAALITGHHAYLKAQVLDQVKKEVTQTYTNIATDLQKGDYKAAVKDAKTNNVLGDTFVAPIQLGFGKVLNWFGLGKDDKDKTSSKGAQPAATSTNKHGATPNKPRTKRFGEAEQANMPTRFNGRREP